ncbi:pulmonary surfactant-associated protein D-like isoform X3 [Myotis yumanensis]|uniref:pulmonary surfactant-associated protein D-like isoform X3 n=1 Tax=Myotis yumanensis TaxID=159337 RepID=UPI0038D36270
MAMLLLLSVLVLLTQPPTSWGEEVTTLAQKPLIDDCTLVTCSPLEIGLPDLDGKEGPLDIAALRRQVKALQIAFLQYKKVELFPHGRGVGQKVFKSAGFQKPFQEAEQVCAQAGGQLPSPLSEAENHALQQLVEAEDKGNAFLSMTFSKVEGRFTYPGGESLVYTNWSPGEPNNDGGNEYCVEMYTNGKWNDKFCGEKRLVICEF